MAENRYGKGIDKGVALDVAAGKVPPQALELEEAVLGAMLLEKDAFVTVSEILNSDCFYKEAHQVIFEAITNLFTREQPIDILTVTEELRRMGKLDAVGGAFYITQLTGRVASAAHIEYHSRIIYQKYLQREMIRISGVIQTKAFDESEDVNDLLEEAENSLFMLSQGSMKRDAIQIKGVISEAIEHIKIASKREDGLSGIPSGFTELDKITSGWQNSDLVIIAARPAMGKTAFVLSMARNMVVKYKHPVAIFSLEMSNLQLVNRLIVSETELDANKIKNGKLSPEEWSLLESRIKSLTEAPIFIDDTPAISVFELRAKCRRLKAQNKLDVVVVDYLQLMTGPPDAGSREQEVSSISRSLKSIAKELVVPVLALSQLNRSVETRGGNKKPMLSDLRESGAIEQDADMVVFIHRPEKMGVSQFEDGQSTKGHADIILAKNRNGPTDEVQLYFKEDRASFVEPDEFGPEVSFPDLPNGGVFTMGSKMNDDISSDYSDFSPDDNGRKPF